MKLLVESIRNAVEKDCLIPALMSSLTIPDAFFIPISSFITGRERRGGSM